MISVIRGAGKIPLPDLPLSETGTPERLIAGIVAGLTLGIDAGDCAGCVEGSGDVVGDFFGRLVVEKVGVERWSGCGAAPPVLREPRGKVWAVGRTPGLGFTSLPVENTSL